MTADAFEMLARWGRPRTLTRFSDRGVPCGARPPVAGPAGPEDGRQRCCDEDEKADAEERGSPRPRAA